MSNEEKDHNLKQKLNLSVQCPDILHIMQSMDIIPEMCYVLTQAKLTMPGLTLVELTGYMGQSICQVLFEKTQASQTHDLRDQHMGSWGEGHIF